MPPGAAPSPAVPHYPTCHRHADSPGRRAKCSRAAVTLSGACGYQRFVAGIPARLITYRRPWPETAAITTGSDHEPLQAVSVGRSQQRSLQVGDIAARHGRLLADAPRGVGRLAENNHEPARLTPSRSSRLFMAELRRGARVACQERRFHPRTIRQARQLHESEKRLCQLPMRAAEHFQTAVTDHCSVSLRASSRRIPSAAASARVLYCA